MKLSQLLRSAHDSGVDESQFKGWQKYYNSTTHQGRFNVAASTVGALFLTIAYFALRPKKQPAIKK